MTDHDFDRALAGWFEVDALAPAPAGGLDRVIDVTRRRTPRPAWLAGFDSGWVGEPPDAGPGARTLRGLGLRWSTAVLLLLVIAALVGGAILVGALLLRPSPLPAGHLGRLAYVLDGDIFVADWDGTNAVRIADGDPFSGCDSVEAYGQMWSPDGLHLVYRSGCRESVIISDPAGRVVTEFPGTGWFVAWSPDSTRVATWAELSRTIGIYGIDGLRQALLALPPGREPHGDFDPVWSPDGASLLISLGPLLPESGTSQVWELPVDGRPPRVVPTSDPRSHRDAVYSNDRARVAFVDEPDSASLVIAGADGTELRVLAGAKYDPDSGRGDGAYYANPAWLPTSDRVAFIWSDSRPDDQASNPVPIDYELRVVDVGSGEMTMLARSRGPYAPEVLGFSPAGDRILFSRWDTSDALSLWSVRTDGSEARLLVRSTDSGAWQFLPATP